MTKPIAIAGNANNANINSPGRGGVIIAHGDAVGDAPGVEAGVFSHRGPIGP